MIFEVMQTLAPAQLPLVVGYVAFGGGIILLIGVLKYLSWRIAN